MTERESQLLSAYLDGECSPAEVARAEELLARSAEARVLLQQLRQQQRLLRALEPLPSGEDWSRLIVKRLKRRQKKTQERRQAQTTRWLWRAAAVVLLAGTATLVAWLLNAPRGERERPLPPLVQGSEPTRAPRSWEEVLAAHRGPELEQALQSTTRTLFDAARGAWHGVREQANLWRRAYEDARPMVASWWQRSQVELARLGFFAENDVLTSPMRLPALPLKRVDLSLPLMFETRDWDTKRLLAQLQAPRLHQLDLSYPDALRGLERLLAAAKTVGLNITVDADLQAQIERKRLTGPLVVYIENLTHAETEKLLLQWHTAEQAAGDDSACRSLILFPLERTQVARWAQVLGVPPATLRLEDRRVGLPNVDTGKPLSDDTLKHLRHLAEGPGMAFRRPSGPPAVALSLRPTQPHSKETRAVLDGRLGPRTGAVSLLIVLRSGRS